jgi:uncharacterized protein with PIN domain
MSQAILRFYGNLNDFLPLARRQVGYAYPCVDRGSVKDLIESIGAPHTEVEYIIVNDQSVDFSYLVQDSDRIDVYPIFEPVAVTPLVPLRPPLPSKTDFVLDTHLGQLAVYLRMLGFDTLYRNDYLDEELARISSIEQRVLLTRDRGLLKRSIVTYGYYIRETNPQRQVAEVLRRYNLFTAISPFRRCIRCNGMLQPISKAEVRDRIPPKTYQYYDTFHICETCGQIYWKGSHYERMQQFIENVLSGDLG